MICPVANAPGSDTLGALNLFSFALATSWNVRDLSWTVLWGSLMRKPIGGTHEPNSSLSPLAGSLGRRPGFQEDFRSGRQSGDAVGGGGSSPATASGAGLLSLPVIGWGGQSGRAALLGSQHHRHLD